MARGDAAEAARAQAMVEERARSVLVTTGNVAAKVEPVKIVFAVGGHAVVHCSFGYAVVSSSGCGGGAGFTVHGYGTVVRLV